MKHIISTSDQQFKNCVEDCSFPAVDFNHRAHLRLAYIYLAENSIESSNLLVREALYRLLRHNNIEPTAKYHETLTRAWLLAVNHFMKTTKATKSADEFIEKNPCMLNSDIMMTHYSRDRLFSKAARNAYIEPDLEPIPIYSA